MGSGDTAANRGPIRETTREGRCTLNFKSCWTRPAQRDIENAATVEIGAREGVTTSHANARSERRGRDKRKIARTGPPEA